MNPQKKVLGRGLGALIPQRPPAEAPPPPPPGSGLAMIAIDQISPNPFQPRKTFNESSIEELARSVREHGIVQPLVVTRIADNKYRLIAGERRFRAAQKAGL
jgi:ParB family chromosome partitioning protein